MQAHDVLLERGDIALAVFDFTVAMSHTHAGLPHHQSMVGGQRFAHRIRTNEFSRFCGAMIHGMKLCYKKISVPINHLKIWPAPPSQPYRAQLARPMMGVLKQI